MTAFELRVYLAAKAPWESLPYIGPLKEETRSETVDAPEIGRSYKKMGSVKYMENRTDHEMRRRFFWADTMLRMAHETQNNTPPTLHRISIVSR